MPVENAAPTGAGDAPISAHEAAALMTAPAPVEKPKEQEQPAAEAPASSEAAPAQDSPETAIAGAEEQPTGETEAPEATETSPIDAPKFWNAQEKEAFAALPRAAQESILARERTRNAEIDRRMQEIAQTRKASEAEREAALQARQRYEQALPQLYQTLQQQVAGEFQDIKTWEDVEKMQQSDPLRFQRWQVRTQQAQQLAQETQASQSRQREEQTKRFTDFVTEQTTKFLEMAPEYADPKTASAKQAEVKAMFHDVGVTEDELKALWHGQPMSIHDHRVQLVVRDAARWRAAQKALKAAKPQGAPVQKPGTATNRGEASSERVRGLHDELRRTGSARVAAQILNARRG